MGDGFIYASLGLDNRTCRHAVSIFCALEGKSLRIETPSSAVEAPVVLVRPLTSIHLQALTVPFVVVDVEPNHPEFRSFALQAAAWVEPFGVSACAALVDVANGFWTSRVSGRTLDNAVREAVSAFAKTMPAPAPLDPRVAWMMSMLDRDPSCPLPALASTLGIGMHRASRLFSNQLGLPLRAYALSVKTQAAARFMGSGMPLTKIAQIARFVDSAHFAKIWRRFYGASPSAFFPPRRTQLDQTELPDWKYWSAARQREHAAPRS